MKTTSIVLACALLALVPLASGQATRTKGSKGKNGPAAATPVPVPETGYGLYRMVRLKNIFDPDRRPMPVEGGAPVKAPPSTGGNRNSYLTLTGTMVTETKRLAFFSGSTSDYNRVVKAHDKVGDLVVENIMTSHVDLKRGEENITLAVGKQLTVDRGGSAGAAVTTPPTPAEGTASVSSPAVTDPVASTPAPSQVGDPLDSNEVARRMRERRLKETR